MKNYKKCKAIEENLKNVLGTDRVEIGHQKWIAGGGYALEINGRRIGKRGTLKEIETYAEIFIKGYMKSEAKHSNGCIVDW